MLARREMLSWTQLQLEPSALRRPDDFSAPRQVAPDGGHVAASMFAAAQREEQSRVGGGEDYYAAVANRVAELVPGVRSVEVAADDRRQLLEVVLTDSMGNRHPASALSDGTLRFLALAVIEREPGAAAVLCMEEPENGIHPMRIEPLLDLLLGIAVDPTEPVDDTNPLRQVIVNTHSPRLVGAMPDDALLIATTRLSVPAGSARLHLRSLPGTWRDGAKASRGDLLRYLGADPRITPRAKTVADVAQVPFPFASEGE